jgi:xylulose-5-phosphate/fructose-6-phosphate phosphoketolase
MVATKASLGELSSYGVARATVKGAPLSDEELRKLHAFWRATNYLALGMIYLQDNPLLREKLKPEHVKSRMLGHWGTSPALSFIYTHLNRVIKLFDLDMVYMAGPGHGGPGVFGPVYIEGRYSEIYPEKGEDIDGLRRFFQEFLFRVASEAIALPKHPVRPWGWYSQVPQEILGGA